jgi:wobble nucleotide-excising tRNase
MIEQITRIKGLGVFKDYRPTPTMQAFGVKNVVYGWNYSGKTTLSRILAMLERRRPEPGLPSFEFAMRTSGGGVVDHTNYQATTLQVRVFNADFVAANLNFAGDHFNPIFLLGEESKAAIERIARCDRLLARFDVAESVIRAADDAAAASLSAARTAKAAAIRDSLSLSSTFRANNLDKEVESIRQGASANILGLDALEADLHMARSADQDRLPGLSALAMDVGLASLRRDVGPALGKTPDMANTIDHLLRHPEVEQWVGAGVKLHPPGFDCAFCGGPVSADRLGALRAHFSKDLAIHAGELASLASRIARARLAYSPRAGAELYGQFRERHEAAAEWLSRAIERHNAGLDDLQEALARKAASPRTAVELPECEMSAWSEAAEAIAEVNRVFSDNNKVSNNFDQSKAEAVKRVKSHYAAEFAAEQDLDGLERNRRNREARRGRLHRWRNGVKAEAARQRAVINRAQRGREEINGRVQSLLGPACVQIEVVQAAGEDRFRLARRDGRAATHLSEGEKTAIAFAYFLAKLKELPDLSQAIVCIDDPISSLDSNHMFQVVALIREAFFHQVADGPARGWGTRCAQLFVLTHNFNFFALMREIKPDKKTPTKARHFLVKKISSTESALVDLPPALLHYTSEYHFLFGILDKFRKERGDDEIELLLMLPNAMRRFVELYTYSRMPSADDVTVDTRAEKLFGVEPAKRILKALHYFSHANNIERLAENNDLICDIESAIDLMLSHIEDKDPIHWNALMDAHRPAVA